jgi:demethylmenaquinone methyltransferase/2-methoxy-6-polyprenyl-1,4-benzoquinol methylase
MSHSSYDHEPPYAKYLSRLIRPFPNFDFFFIKPVREKAVEALQLSPGGQVLDLGCGGGGSFPYLVRAVGSAGKVVGVDISPQSCINARRRVSSNGWKNVEVIEASAERVHLSGRYDGALMFAAADVYASESALSNILPYLKGNARVSFFGAKLSRGPLSKFLNPFFLFMCRKLSPTTPIPDEVPWGMLASRLKDLKVQEFFFGSMFLACGTFKEQRSGA